MSSITLTPLMLATLDATMVARLQALVAMASLAPVAAPAPMHVLSERHSQMLEGIAAMDLEKKEKKTLSPEHLAKMKAGREAAKLKKQLVATLEPAPLVAAVEPVAEVAPVAKVSSKKGQPTAWADWVKKTLAENKDEIAAYKQAAEQKAGASLKWVSENKGKASPEWQAFKATWAETHPKIVSVPASDVEEAVPEPVAVTAPLTLSLIKVVNDTAAYQETETESDSEPVVTPPIKKKRGPKPLSEMSPTERATHDAKVAERKAAKAAKAANAIPPVAALASVGGGGALASCQFN